MSWKTLQKAICSAICALGLAAGASATPHSDSVRWSTIRWSDDKATALRKSGREVELGLDLDLQQDLKRLLRWARPVAGAATLVDVASGQILAAAEVGDSPASLLFDPVAPAASVFKIVTTAALYERTSISPVTSICTKGGLKGITRRHLHPASGPGTVCSPFAHALGVSRNAVFAQLATQELMRQDLVEIGSELGFNAALPMDAPGSVGQLQVPYNDLEFARAAAGFKGSQLSVFGGAHLALVVATGGTSRTMHFARETKGLPRDRQVLSRRTARRLRDAMEVTVHSGTARSSFVDPQGHSRLGPIQAAGKTGTLQPSPGKPTASWFIGFAPSNRPMVVVSVLLQNPARWHRKGHQLARDLLATYFRSRGVEGLDVPL